jgi:hypothetical protein
MIVLQGSDTSSISRLTGYRLLFSGVLRASVVEKRMFEFCLAKDVILQSRSLKEELSFL